MVGETIDFCDCVGKRYADEISTSWLIPALVPSRFYTFFWDNEKCAKSSWSKLGFVDRERNELAMTPKCQSGKKPRLLVAVTPEYYCRGSSSCRQTWEERALPLLEKQEGIIVNINKKDNKIEIEIDPPRLRVIHRDPVSDGERTKRQMEFE